MTEDLSEHENVVASRIMIEVGRDGTTRTILLVETDLDLDPEGEEYDRKAVAGLLDAVKAYLAANAEVQAVNLVPAGEEGEEDDDEDDDDERRPRKSARKRDDDEEEDDDDDRRKPGRRR